MDPLVRKVQTYLDAHSLIPPGSLVVAAVSGGADSLSLLLLLNELKHDNRFELETLHVHHGLRGRHADADLLFVQDWCRKLGLVCHVRHRDVAAQASREANGIELAARHARQACYDELVRSNSSRTVRIALAHHRDDQAETVLLHLGRGSGLDGLAGMKPADGYLIRPLLDLSRSEIESWLRGRQIDWRTDASNTERFTIRNRLRLDVLPAWKDALGYDPAPVLCRTAESLSADRDLLNSLARAAYQRLIIRSARGDESCQLDRSQWQALHPALQIRCLRLLWQQATGSGKDLAAAHIRLMLAFLQKARAGQSVDLPNRWRLVVEQAAFSIQPADRHCADETKRPAMSVLLNLPGVTNLPQLSIFVDADFIENEGQIVYNSAMESFRLNAIKGCVLRLRQPGDRIHPVGRNVGKSLKKFLNEQAVNPDDRASLPVIACGSEIVWLPGYAAGEGFVARSGDGGSGPLIRLTIRNLAAEPKAVVAK